MNRVLDLKTQYELQDVFLKEKLDQQLAGFMLECGIDMWIIPSKEYCEDPLFTHLTPSTFPTARRLTILVASLKEGKLSRYCVCRFPDLEEFYENVWLDKNVSQWDALESLIEKVNPKTIGLNISNEFAYCDGLSKGIYDEMVANLSEKTCAKFTSAQFLGVRYLETRTAQEMAWYPKIADLALSIVDEAFSNQVITPGVTTTSEVEWWMKQKVNDLGLTFWFPPDVNLQRRGDQDPQKTDVIQRGDFIHCDFGITYLGLCTDTQRNAYIALEGEEEIPQDIMNAFKVNNHFQDIVCENFITGRSGNQIFTSSLQKANEEGIKAMLYSHPCGRHGHAAGPTIGLFNKQEEIPVQGDLILHDDTAYALELNTKAPLAHWDQQMFYIFSEETVLYKDQKVHYLSAGRNKINLIK